MRLVRISCLALIGLALAVASPARSQSVEQFYKGKTITILIGHPTGGSYDLYARLAAAHMSKYIPGNPNIMVQSRPGGGGVNAVAYFYAEAPRDGTMMGLFPEGIGQIQLLEPAIAKWKVQDMSYVGSFAPVNLVFARRKDSPAKTIEDMRAMPSNVGCSGRTGQSFENPQALNVYAGFKFKIICGYPGSAEFTLALYKGEIDMVSSAWNQWTAEHPGELADGTFVPVIQCGLARHKDLPDVPLMQELTNDPKGKLVMNLLCAAAAIGRDLSLPPKVPADRLAALRTAFDKMVADPELIAEANARHLELDPKTGADVQKISDSILDTPKDVLASAGEAFK